MTDTPQNALSAEEWAKRATGNDETGDVVVVEGAPAVVLEFRTVIEILNPHGAAALCLYGQPFGFTQEDVDLLYSLGAYLTLTDLGTPEKRDGLQSILHRVASLLPPP